MVETSPAPVAHAKMDCFESVRGLAAQSVLIAHVLLTFCPALYYRCDERWLAYPGWLRAFSRFPGKFLWNGELPLELFFVLSGFVLSLAYFQKGSLSSLTSGALRRYLRLMIPIFAAVMLAFVLMRCGLMQNRETANLLDEIQGLKPNPQALGDCSNNWLRSLFAFEPDAVEALREGAYGAFFERPKYDPVLWSMPFELAGSYLVYASLALFGGLRRRWIIYALGGALVQLTCHRFLLDIVIGIALCDLYVTNAKTWRRTLGLASALVLVALAVFVIPWRPVAAAMIVVAVAGSPRLQELLSARWLAWLGRTSFGLYLIHMPILCSVSCGLFNWLCRDQGWDYVPAAILASVVGLAVVYVGSWLFWLLVDNPALTLPRWLEGKIFRPKPADPAAATLPMSKAA